MNFWGWGYRFRTFSKGLGVIAFAVGAATFASCLVARLVLGDVFDFALACWGGGGGCAALHYDFLELCLLLLLGFGGGYSTGSP